MRYRLLETIRQYAASELAGRGNDVEAAARELHAEYFYSLAEVAAGHLTGGKQADWLARLDQEHDNLRLALETVLRDALGSVRPLRFVAALRWFWQIRGYSGEGVEALEAALARSDAGLTRNYARRR